PAPAAPVAEPAARPTAPRTNLRAGLSSFIGRDADVARVRDLVGEYRLTTLTGPGGSGKTRLAGEASRGLTDRMPDGVWLVELAPVAAGADVPAAVLAALDLRDQAFGTATEDTTGRLVAALRTRSALLVLDNCEHVIDAAAALADRLLGDCPDLRILATSREPLGITGEAVWPVEPLALPPAHDGDAAGLLRFDAVRLLVDRARAVRPGFTVTDDDAPAVARICRALDGMPLAIELAAARLRTMTVEQLAARLDDRFRLLTGGSRTALPRHQTLRAVVDWSWELLSERERVVLRRLAVFAGGATAEAAARVCGDGADVLDQLISLSDRSLVVVDDDGEAPRYRLLETIKAYGLERLDEAGELDAVRRAHIGWLIELAVTAEPHLHRAEQLVWLRRMRAEHDDITAALRGAIAAGDAENAVRLVAACGWYWFSGHKSEGIELGIEALAVPGPTDREARATACAVVTFLITSGVGDLREAADWVRQARELAVGVENPGPFLRFMRPLSVILGAEDDPLTSLADTLAPLLEDPDPWFRAQARLTRAQMLPAAEREADVTQALAEFRLVGERWGISYALTTLADLFARRGELERAIEYYEQAIVAITEIGTIDDVVMMRSRLAQLRWLAGDHAGSDAEVAQAERDAEQVAWPDGLAIMALNRASLAIWAGDRTTAEQQLDRAQALLRDVPVHPVFRAVMLELQAWMDAEHGRWDAAAAARTEALAAVLNSDDSDEESVGAVLVGIADHALRRDRPADAVRLLAAVEVLAGGLNRSTPWGVHADEAARAALGDGAASALLEETERELAGMDADAAHSWLRELAASVLGPPLSGPAGGGTA
ncbi:ATP-binding protein, partial [Jiangella rhizosphaerae]